MKLLKIIFFPITLIVMLIKNLIKGIQKKHIGNFFKNLTISKIDALTGEQFEDVCKLMFCYAGYNVQKTASSNDYGADLLLTKKLKIVVQAKLYYKHGVGNHAVQEVTSAIKYYGAAFGVVITNWKFTNQAKTMAKIQNVLLIDRGDVLQFFQDVKSKTKQSKIFSLEKSLRVEVVEC